MTTNKFNFLFRLVLKALKYFVFIVFGFIFAAYLSAVFGTSHITWIIFPTVFEIIWRCGIILISLAGVAILIESFR